MIKSRDVVEMIASLIDMCSRNVDEEEGLLNGAALNVNRGKKL